MIRQIMAVIVGFAVWTALWLAAGAVLKAAMPEAFLGDGGVNENGLLVLFILLSVTFSVPAGFITATVSSRNEMKPVMALAVIQVVIGTLAEVISWNVIPVWYHVVFILLLAPAILVGGKLGMARKMRSSALA